MRAALIVLLLARVAVAEVPVPSPPPPPPPLEMTEPALRREPPSWKKLHPAVFVCATVLSLTALAGGIAMRVNADSTHSEFSTLGIVSPNQLREISDRESAQAAWANAGFIAGSALAVSAVLIAFFTRWSE